MHHCRWVTKALSAYRWSITKILTYGGTTEANKVWIHSKVLRGTSSSKHNQYSPRPRHKTAIRNDSWKDSERIEEALERNTVRTIRGAMFQSGSCSYSEGRAGNTLKGLPQLSEVKEIHAHMMECGNQFDLFENNTLMDMYVRCGSMVDARHVFDNMSKHNVVSWNMMILGYAKQGEGALALELYAQLLEEGVQPSDRTFVAALKACSSLAALEEAKQVGGELVKIACLEKGKVIHSQALKSDIELNVFICTTLVDTYVKCGSMDDARHVFDELPRHDVVSWTAMILGYGQNEEGALALELYACMCKEGVAPNSRALVGALKACSSLAVLEENQIDGKMVKGGSLKRGRDIHFQAVERGLESDVFVGTSLVDMYAKCGSKYDAWFVFDKLPQRNVVIWNAMILGYAQSKESELALDLYARMHEEGVQPSDRTFVAVLRACSSLTGLEEGKKVDGKYVKLGCQEKSRAIHFHVMICGFELNIFISNALVDTYAKCGSMEDARHVFDKTLHHDVVSFTAMISGYAEQEDSEEALKLHAQMQQQGLAADSVTFVEVVKACGTTAALETGRKLHAQICMVGHEENAILATTLIDMYAKCGSMFDAQHLFDALSSRDLVTWNTLIAGYAHLGESESVFHLFERMRPERIQPNGVTFLNMLTVCNHAGLVDTGQTYFQAMRTEYDNSPTLEHYNCMVDLLGRAGQVDQAVAMVEKMPLQPNGVSWLAMLGACQRCKNVEVGRHAFENVERLDENNPVAYVMMSNIYAHAHVWEDCDKTQVKSTDIH